AYQILIPALMIGTLANARLGQQPIAPFAAAVLGPTVVASGLLLFGASRMMALFRLDGPAFTSVFQGVVRWNSFIAIALAGTLHGAEGLTLVALALVLLVPFVNFASAVAMTRHGSAAKPFVLLPFLAALIRNPFIWSTLLGLAIMASGLRLPGAVLGFVDVLGRGALAAGLLLVGAGLNFSALRQAGAGVTMAVVVRLIIMPAATGTIALMLGLSGAALGVAMICAAVPTAAASYIVARQDGGDAPLMAGIISAQTIACAVTMPIALILAG
ncbi:MAG: AEC family transporter, partial [Beijerinckiaceae bacterium]